MTKTKQQQHNTLFTAVGVEYYTVWTTQYYCLHFVHCSYTGLQIFIVFFCTLPHSPSDATALSGPGRPRYRGFTITLI